MFAKKKRVELVGSLEYPLAIGNAAFIKEAAGLRCWSSPHIHGTAFHPDALRCDPY